MSQSVHFHRVEWARLHQWDTNRTPDTNGTPSPPSVLSAICLLTSTPCQPKAPCHLLEVEGWAGDRSRKTTCFRSFSDSNNYHAIIHRQGSVFFSFLLRADKSQIPGFGEDILKRTRKKKKWKWSSVTALAWHICSGYVRVYSADDSRITNKTWAIRLLSPYGLSLALACSGHVAHPKYVLKWVVSVSVHESG